MFLKKLRQSAFALCLFSSLFGGHAALAQTVVDDDDGFMAIIGALLGQPITPTVTSSLELAAAGAGQPMWYTVKITNPAALAPLKGVQFSRTFNTAILPYISDPGMNMSPAACTGTLALSPTAPYAFSLTNGLVPPQTTCTYRVRVTSTAIGVQTVPAVSISASNATATVSTAAATTNTALIGYSTTISVSPPPYLVGAPITFTATAPVAAGTVRDIKFYGSVGANPPLALSGETGTGLSRTLVYTPTAAGSMNMRAWVDATGGPSVVDAPLTVFVSDFKTALNVIGYRPGSTANSTLVTYQVDFEMNLQTADIVNNVNLYADSGAISVPGYSLSLNGPNGTNPNIKSYRFDTVLPDAGPYTVQMVFKGLGKESRSNFVTAYGIGGSGSAEGQSGVNIPTGNTVGATAGSFDVTDSGAATYNIPIAIPPGTAGLAPSLALGYSSQGGSGMAGVGWSLSGTSAVHRCSANQFIDGKRSALTYDANDKFCIDGQRLIKLTADGTYRTERDSFSRITAFGQDAANPDYWMVESKAGLIMLYGTSEANAGANAKFGGAPNGAIRAWALNKVKDRRGNYYKIDYVYDYLNGATSGQVVAQRPVSMHYTGNDASGRATFASVELQYEANTAPEQVLLYGAKGVLSQNLFRLSKVVTKEGANTVRTYTLAYKTSVSSKRSILTSVQECGYGAGGGAGLCLPATVVTTPDAQPSELAFTTLPTLPNLVPLQDRPHYVGDFDGDGKSDLLKYIGGSDGNCTHTWEVYLSGASAGATNPATWCTNYGNARVVLGDFDGNGKTDLLTHFGGDGSSQWQRCISTGTNFSCTAVVLASPGNNKDIPNESAADFDGDGRTDVVIYVGRCSGASSCANPENPTGTALTGDQVKLAICLATDTGFTCKKDPRTADFYIGPSQATAFSSLLNVTGFSIGDFNGDGRADIAVYQTDAANLVTNAWQIAFSNFGNGSSIEGFTFGPPRQPGPRTRPEKQHVADFNGDGLADLVAVDPDQAGMWKICKSIGNGSLNCESWAGRTTSEDFLLGDFNGDGRTDFAQWDTTVTLNQWKVCLSTGIGLNCSHWGSDVASGGGRFSETNLTGDFNGDGKTDIIALTGSGTSFVWKRASPTGKIPDLVTQIKDGLGKEFKFTQEPLTTTGAYTKGTGAAFPVIDIQSPMYVVTSMSTNNGIGGMRSFSYQYNALQGHANGGGLLGFRTRTVTDTLTGNVTTTTYSRDYANRLAGTPETTVVSNSAGKKLGESSSTFHVSIFGSSPKIYRIFPATSTSLSYDPLLETPTSTNTLFTSSSSSVALADIDTALGNVRKSTTTSGGLTTVTTTTFDSDEASWMIGRPATVSVASTYQGATLTRNSSFSYVSGTSLVSVETIEPNDATVSVSTYHDYDVSGNRTESRVVGSGIVGAAATKGCSQPPGTDNCRRGSVGYDANGRFAVSTTNAANHTSTASYNGALGVVIESTDPNGIRGKATYDYLGRKIAGYSSVGINETVAYGAPDATVANSVMKISTTASASPPSIAHVDILGREVRRDTQGADGFYYSVSMSYDARGRKTSASRPYPTSGSSSSVGSSSFSYENDMDRLVREVAPDGGVTVIEPRGLTTTIRRAPSGEPVAGGATTQTTTRTVNEQGWTVSVKDALGNTTTYAHDAHGNLLRVNKPNQPAVVMSYDIRGRKRTLADPDAGAVTYDYNAAGDLLSEDVAVGRRVTASYDALGRAIVRTSSFPSLNKEYTTSYFYDGNNAIGKMIGEGSTTPSGNFSRNWEFDTLSRPSISKVAISPAGQASRNFTTITLYDANSRVEKTAYPVSGKVLKYSYTNGYFSTAQYDGRTVYEAKERFPDQQIKTAAMGSALTMTRTYDALGRVATIKTVTSAATLQNGTFTFDTIGNLTGRTDSAAGINDSYCYDVLNRLRGNGTAGACSNIYSYDTYGNLTKPGITLTYGAVTSHNRLTAVNGVALSYDVSGNVTGDGSRVITYSPYQVPDRISQGALWTEWGFTGNGQRAFERRGSNTTTTGITYQAGPGFFEQDETIANGSQTVTETREYLNTPAGVVGVVVRRGATASINYYLQDHLGSNIASVTEAGAIISRSRFDPWGVRTVTAGNAGVTVDSGERGFTGHEHLDFGLIHMNGRVYDPAWGRFLQADPIIQSPYDLQNYNRYSYVMNNPLSFTDPTGYSAWSRRWRPAIVAAIGNYICGGYPCGTIAVAYHNGGAKAAGWAVASYISPVIAGFAEAGANGGGLKNGIFLAFANVAGSGGTGNIYADIALNAAGGCARGRVYGTGCANGAGNAVASQFVSAGVSAAGNAAVAYVASLSQQRMQVAGGDVNGSGIVFDTKGEAWARYQRELQATWDAMRKIPEIKSIDDNFGPIKVLATTSERTSYNSDTKTISVNPEIFYYQFRTALPAEWSSLPSVQYDMRLAAMPEWSNFTLTRVLAHEAFHATQGRAGFKYGINIESYESPAIQFENTFSFKYYGEMYRRNHYEVRRQP